MKGNKLPLSVVAYGVAETALNEMQGGDYDKAAEGLFKALAIEPKNHEWWTQLGDCYYALNFYDRAENCFRKALALVPEYLPPMLGLAETLSITRRQEEAWEILQEARALTTSPDIENATGNCLFQMNRYGRALRCYEKAVKMDPDNGTSWVNMAVCLRQMGRFYEAMRACQNSIEAKQHDWTAVLGLATEHLLRANWTEGWDLYEVRLLNPAGIYKRYAGIAAWDGASHAA